MVSTNPFDGRFGLGFFLAVALPALLHAQQPYGTIRGVVTDPDGSRVPGAEVRTVSESTGYIWRTTTDHTGFFLVALPPADEYVLSVRKNGFQAHKQRGIVMTVHGQVRLVVDLAIGDVQQEVVVEDRPPLLTTDDGRLKGEIISQEEILAMPVLRRDYERLALLVPGVVPEPAGATGKGSFLSANGARADQTSFFVDGLSNRRVDSGESLVRPNVNSVREFRVETSGYSARYGRNGGGAIHIGLKSGTNELHGDLFEDHRNSHFDSRKFFAKRDGRPKDDLKYNRFGAALGGPIIVPGWFDGRDRTFFHFSYEGLRAGNDDLRTSAVPTLLERRGDFSQSGVFLRDPQKSGLCGPANQIGCFANSVIPESRFDSVGAGAASLFPLPTEGASLPNAWYSNANLRRLDDSLALKVDHQISPQDRLSFRVQRARFRSSRPLLTGSEFDWGANTRQKRALAGLSYTRVFSPSLVFEAQVGASRRRDGTEPTNLGVEQALAIGITVPTDDPEYFGMPFLAVQDYLSLGPPSGVPNLSAVRDAELQTNFNYLAPGHSLTWGFTYSSARFEEPRNINLRGAYSFGNPFTFTGDAVGDILLGAVARSHRRRAPGVSDLRSSGYAAYLNDDWSLSRGLTINLGMRYEVNRPFVDRFDRLSNFIPESAKSVIADDRMLPHLQEWLAELGGASVVLAGDAGLPRSLVHTDYGNWAPRIGLAWRPFGGGRTVLRAGYGIYYSSTLQGDMRIFLGDSFPVSVDETFSARVNMPIPLSDPFQPAFRASLYDSRRAVELKPQTPYLQSWNLTIERDLGAGIALEAAYVGSKGTHLSRWRALNDKVRSQEIFEATGGKFANPDPRYGALNYFTFGSNSSYQAAQVSLRSRPGAGLFFRVNYTFSKSIDEASSFNADEQFQLFSYAPSLDRGRSSFDRRHVLNAAWSWEVPVGRGRRWLSRAGSGWQGLLGGWRLSGLSRVLSGAPFTVRTMAIPDRGESNRPNRIGGGVPNEQPGIRGVDYPWYLPEDFEKVPCALASCQPSEYGFQPFEPGNSGRNILDLPPAVNLDVTMAKDFMLSEAMKFGLRVEAFNVFNRVNLTGLQTQMDTRDRIRLPGFFNAASEPRSIQVGLRFSF